MPDLTPENKPITLGAIQAALAAAIATCITLAYPNQVTAANIFGNLTAMLIVLLGERVVNRENSKNKIQDATRGMRLLQDEITQKLAMADENDPLRPTWERHLVGLAEAIYRKTIETDYVVVTPETPEALPAPAPPASLPQPKSEA